MDALLFEAAKSKICAAWKYVDIGLKFTRRRPRQTQPLGPVEEEGCWQEQPSYPTEFMGLFPRYKGIIAESNRTKTNLV